VDFPQFPQGTLLLITNDYPPRKGGVSWYYYNLVRGLNADFTQSDAVHNSLQLPLILRGRERCEVLKAGRWTMTPLWPLIIFPLLLKTHQLKTNTWWAGQVLPVGTVVWLLSFVWKKPYIVSTHGMDVLMPLKSKRRRWLVGKILQRAALITANSEWTREEIVRNYESGMRNHCLRQKIAVIFPEPKPKREVPREEAKALRLQLKIPEGATVLLTACRLVKRKGVDRVLAALPEVWKAMPDLHYIIVGNGEERQKLETMVGARSIAPVHFVGEVSDEELAAYYSLADAFILLPREEGCDAEGFGIVYREADQYGLPIVGCVSGGTGEALQQCRKTLLVENPDDPKSVAEKICQAFQ